MITKIACDWCAKLDVCRFQWLRDHDDMPMMFCSFRCMENHVGWYMASRYKRRALG
jgi:hypothetical protein